MSMLESLRDWLSPAIAAKARADACKRRGNDHLGRGEFDAAFACYEEATSIAPDFAEALNNMGFVRLRQRRFDDARRHLMRALALKPGLASVHYNLGNVEYEQGNASAAVGHYRDALATAPADVEIRLQLAEALRSSDRIGDAIACLREGAANAGNAAAFMHVRIGNLLQEQNLLDEAIDAYRSAITLAPDVMEAHNNMGAAYQRQGRLDEAVGCFTRALALDPERAPGHYNASLAQLAAGDLTEGWKNHEYRFFQGSTIANRGFPQPRWSGEEVSGKSVLIWGEQGIGDEMLFAGMFGEIIGRAGRCVIECTPKLLTLFARSFPSAQVVPRSDPPHPATLQDIDFQCAAGSLAQWLRPSIDSFPRHAGYLVADPLRVSHWRTRLAGLGPGLKVGFCWRSRVSSSTRGHHYTRLDQWGPIFAVPGVHFINLQYDECDAELDAARQRFGVELHAFREVDLFNDLDEAAALTRALDLVITAPTAASGLAAAQGVPTWEMSHGTTWVTLGTDHVPWFPAQRMFPRRWDQPWEEIISEVATQLRLQNR